MNRISRAYWANGPDTMMDRWKIIDKQKYSNLADTICTNCLDIMRSCAPADAANMKCEKCNLCSRHSIVDLFHHNRLKINNSKEMEL